MFTRSVRVGCSFPAYEGDSMKFQTCLKFLQPLPTLVSDPNFIHVTIGLSFKLMACRLHFPACRLIKQACLYQVSGLSQILTSRLYVKANRLCGKCYSTITLTSLSVTVPDRPVKFPGQSVTLTDWVLELGKFVTDRP